MRDHSLNSDRRHVLKTASLGGVGLFALSVLKGAEARAATHIKTPKQTEGPFYPIADQLDKDADMTRVQGQADVAAGQTVILEGAILDADSGAPVVGALVEFWQACASGKYNHPDDSNSAPMDPNFQYWSQVRTDHSGAFKLKTIRPGAYPAENGWMRPPHIHVKIHGPDYPSLTTQIYFKGDALNDEDLILQRLSLEEQELVVVDFTETNGAAHGQWSAWITRLPQRLARRMPTPFLD